MLSETRSSSLVRSDTSLAPFYPKFAQVPTAVGELPPIVDVVADPKYFGDVGHWHNAKIGQSFAFALQEITRMRRPYYYGRNVRWQRQIVDQAGKRRRRVERAERKAKQDRISIQ